MKTAIIRFGSALAGIVTVGSAFLATPAFASNYYPNNSYGYQSTGVCSSRFDPSCILKETSFYGFGGGYNYGYNSNPYNPGTGYYLSYPDYPVNYGYNPYSYNSSYYMTQPYGGYNSYGSYNNVPYGYNSYSYAYGYGYGYGYGSGYGR